jgi:hypothetical protein
VPTRTDKIDSIARSLACRICSNEINRVVTTESQTLRHSHSLRNFSDTSIVINRPVLETSTLSIHLLTTERYATGLDIPDWQTHKYDTHYYLPSSSSTALTTSTPHLPLAIASAARNFVLSTRARRAGSHDAPAAVARGAFGNGHDSRLMVAVRPIEVLA